MTIADITRCLEEVAPRSLQESYDNSGLLTGSPHAEVNSALICLDVTEAIVEEAIQKQCGLIISHHPLIFKGLRSLTGRDYVERSLIKAIRHNIAIYAIHTNLDNVPQGVNGMIAEKLGIKKPEILAPKKEALQKLVVFVPIDHTEILLEALFKSGAGSIGRYDECSFQVKGTGSFRGDDTSDPFVGKPGERHYEAENRIEVILPTHRSGEVIARMQEVHPYEEVAYDLYRLDNTLESIGAGMIGYLEEPIYTLDFLRKIKEVFGGGIRHTEIIKDQIQKVAWCGGSGSFLLPDAKLSGADLFLSSDFKYHQFFEAENEIIIADIGHYENEQFTIPLIARTLREKFPNFAVLLTEIITNPVNYY